MSAHLRQAVKLSAQAQEVVQKWEQSRRRTVVALRKTKAQLARIKSHYHKEEGSVATEAGR